MLTVIKIRRFKVGYELRTKMYDPLTANEISALEVVIGAKRRITA